MERDKHMKKYIYDYVTKDPSGAPLKSHFGDDWGERETSRIFYSHHNLKQTAMSTSRY